MLAVEAAVFGQINIAGAGDKNVFLARTPQLAAQFSHLGIHDAEHGTALLFAA